MNEAAKFNIRLMAVPESFHKGTLPQRKSYLSVDKDNIIMTAFKFCEEAAATASCVSMRLAARTQKRILSVNRSMPILKPSSVTMR